MAFFDIWSFLLGILATIIALPIGAKIVLPIIAKKRMEGLISSIEDNMQKLNYTKEEDGRKEDSLITEDRREQGNLVGSSSSSSDGTSDLQPEDRKDNDIA